MKTKNSKSKQSGNTPAKPDKQKLKKTLEKALPQITSNFHKHLKGKVGVAGFRLSSFTLVPDNKSDLSSCHVDANGNWVCE